MIYSFYSSHVSLMPQVLALEFLVVLCVSALALLALQDSDESTWLVRAYLRRKLSGTRYMKMLKQCRIDPANYLRAVPVADIKRQASVCRSCPNTVLCDRSLGKCTTNTDFSFCPNRPSIDRFFGAV